MPTTAVDEIAEKVLDRVRKLVQQSASANRAEAELAAYMACAQIRKAGLEIVDPAEIDGLLRENEDLRQRVLQLEAGVTEPEIDAIRQAAQSLGAQMAQAANATYAAGTATMGSPVALTSKYRGHCKKCGKTYDVGDQILWLKGYGCWCATTSCYNDWQALRNFTP